MDSVGIKKEIDKLGRIVIPSDIRHLYGLTDEVEIIITDEGVLLRHPQYRLVKKVNDEEM